VAFVWELTKETFDLPLGCLQGGEALIVERKQGGELDQGERLHGAGKAEKGVVIFYSRFSRANH